MQLGIFLGFFNESHGATDYAIGTPDGVEAGRAIKPLPATAAWDGELLLASKGLPWDRQRRAREALLVPRGAIPRAMPPPLAEPGPPEARRVYIRRDVELQKASATDASAARPREQIRHRGLIRASAARGSRRP